ncbi:iron ABC transporter permease [Salinivibrio sp. SS3]|uniref:ABC transporter permease n=1 Tax=Salinivibrio sp. SS3 TaxID=1895021 RepID=UPI000847D706|nr:iron chelate uptake ABC transporter family permease subunit [Salinivibrio sp. BNH]ODP99486.1 iron ABC transporter permease [Salinivibrio sp. BNH]
MTLRLTIVVSLLCVVSLMVGSQPISWQGLLDGSQTAWLTLTASRLPRLIAIALTGIGLSISGIILQHIVNNRFVEPATSGGLDAAKLGILVSLTTLSSASTASKVLFAMSFCLVTSLIFIIIIRRIEFRNTVLIPVLGIMYGSVLSSIAEFYAYQNNILQSMQGWLLGDFSKIIQGHYELIYLIIPIVILTYIYAHRFTVLGMGQDVSASLGLNYAWMSALGLILVSITVATSVITVGAIPFVGLVIPNLVVLKYGENLSRTLPIVALGGACLLLICDILGRLILYPYEIPIGLTAGGIGGLIFLVLILKGIR